MMHNIRQYQVPLQKYMAMMDLQVGIYAIYFNFELEFFSWSLCYTVLDFHTILDYTESSDLHVT